MMSPTIAAATIDTLVDVFSFDRERAAEAVRSVDDPGDVESCVNWLLDAGEPDCGGPVVPTQTCPQPFSHRGIARVGISVEKFLWNCHPRAL